MTTRRSGHPYINVLNRRGLLAAGAAGIMASGCASAPADDVPSFRRAKRFTTLHDGLRMAHFEAGRGSPVVFLHGNPTSSYLWRNVIPHVSPSARCIAPDLIGMGDSDKLPNSGAGRYSFAEHARRLEELFERIGVLEDVVLVVHDWGGPLGFDWASRHPERVRGIAFMETFIVSQTDENTPEAALNFFRRFRTAEAEQDVLENNIFVENVLLRQFPEMSEADKQEYRRPFLEAGEARRPTLEWPRQVPINGDPSDVFEVEEHSFTFMGQTQLPKLFIRAEPGRLISGGRENVCRAWPNITECAISGRHYVQEESPDEIGRCLAQWLGSLT